MPPKMLKKMDDLLVARDHLQRIDDSLRVAAAAEVAEVRGPPPATTTTSTVDIESPAPFPRIPTSPSSFTYVTPFSRASCSCGSAGLDVAHLRDVGMPERGAVVDGELGVERAHLAVGGDDQRVDLREHRVVSMKQD
jgi:hypothetical protein